jgi:hypothetical protein
MRIISNITNSNPAIVTTTINNQYLDGTIVRLVVPQGFGMYQANQLTGSIRVITDTTFSIDIDTTFFDSFVLPSSFPLDYNDAQVIPVGAENDRLKVATQNVLPY